MLNLLWRRLTVLDTQTYTVHFIFLSYAREWITACITYSRGQILPTLNPQSNASFTYGCRSPLTTTLSISIYHLASSFFPHTGKPLRKTHVKINHAYAIPNTPLLVLLPTSHPLSFSFRTYFAASAQTILQRTARLYSFLEFFFFSRTRSSLDIWERDHEIITK